VPAEFERDEIDLNRPHESAEVCVRLAQQPEANTAEEEDHDFRADWQLSEILGEGTSSIVHRAIRKGAVVKVRKGALASSSTAVVKVSRPSKEDELATEAKFLQHLGHHPCIVDLLGFYRSEQFGTALVLELGSSPVLDLVESNSCTEGHIRVVAAQVCQALAFIHSRGIVHRDVKAENVVFFGTGYQAKLIDFGTAGFEADDEDMMRRCGSPGYVAPEVIDEHSRCSFVADCFSLGVLVYALIAQRLPFRGKNPREVLQKTQRCHLKFEEQIWSKLTDCQSFVTTLLVKDPNMRPAAEDAWRHPWFSSFHESNGVHGGVF